MKNDCLVCESNKYTKLLECCQTDCDSKYRICRKCVRKSERCPLCRSYKYMTPAKIDCISNSLETDYWILLNLSFAYYRFMMIQYTTDRITALEFSNWLQSDDAYNAVSDADLIQWTANHSQYFTSDSEYSE